MPTALALSSAEGIRRPCALPSAISQRPHTATSCSLACDSLSRPAVTRRKPVRTPLHAASYLSRMARILVLTVSSEPRNHRLPCSRSYSRCFMPV
eukprot:8432327-Pyramimonas_sp.AAC.1